MAAMVEKCAAEYRQKMESVDFSGAVDAALELAHRANLYVEESEPWTLAKDEAKAQDLADVIYNCLETIRLVATMLAPFCTRTSAEACRRIGAEDPDTLTNLKDALVWGKLEAGNSVEVGNALFPRLDEEKILAQEN